MRKSSAKAVFSSSLKKEKLNGSKGWRQVWRKLWFPITGLGAFLWFLIRVIPKPSRATYPCQRAAFPLATSFIIWLTGMFGGALFFGRIKQKFLKSPYLIVALGIAAIVGAIGWSFHWFTGKAAAAPVRLAPSTVAIVQSTQARAGNIQYDEIRSLVEQACDLAGGLETVVQNGDVVVIKPNLVSYNSNGRNLAPEVNGTTTDWRVTKAVVELVRRINPDGKIYVMEGASVPTEQAFNVLKYSSANFPDADLVATLDQDCGAWQDTNSAGIVKVSLPNGRYKKEYYLNRKIKEADVFISLSCLKTHWSCGITGSVKNIGMGAAPPNIYGYSATNPWRNNMVNHNTDDLDKELSDFYECRPAEFTIIDGLQGLQNGPISANTSDQMNMRLILAGKDAVAVDAICGLVMNWDPESINYLQYLNSDSFGNLDTACINVVGKKVDQVRKAFGGQGRGTKVTDKTAPGLTVNSATAQGNTLRLSLAVDPDCVKVEIELDGELQLPAVTSDFGDIVINTDRLSSGSHDVSVNAYDRFLNRTEKTVTVYGQGGDPGSSPGSAPGSSPDSSGNYDAPRAAAAPVIDGLANDNCWEQTPWGGISHVWLGTPPAASDFSGRYKMVWTPERLYYLVEITDDVFSAPYSDPLNNYYNNDCVELFIDEDRSGGEHTNNYNAFAYHIQRDGNITDNATSGRPKLFNDHAEVRVTEDGNVYTWEIALKVFPDTYNEASNANQPVTLTAAKVLGFGVSYNDNDGGVSRDNFIGSMAIAGADKNVAYKNADVFGALRLTAGTANQSPGVTAGRSQTPIITPRPSRTPVLTATPLTSPTAAGLISYSMNDWGSGATVSVTIKNNGTTPVNGWSLVWNFSGNQKISQMWNAGYTQDGTEVTVTNAAHNSTISVGGTASFGFNLTYSGANAKPSGFTLNGAACAVD